MGGVYIMGYAVSECDFSKRNEAEENKLLVISLASLL